MNKGYWVISKNNYVYIVPNYNTAKEYEKKGYKVIYVSEKEN